jgi:hypothetical protein
MQQLLLSGISPIAESLFLHQVIIDKLVRSSFSLMIPIGAETNVIASMSQCNVKNPLVPLCRPVKKYRAGNMFSQWNLLSNVLLDSEHKNIWHQTASLLLTYWEVSGFLKRLHVTILPLGKTVAQAMPIFQSVIGPTLFIMSKSASWYPLVASENIFYESLTEICSHFNP